MALDQHPELRAARGRVAVAAGQADQAGVWSNPELELMADDWPVTGGHGFTDAKQTVGVAQVIPFPGKKGLDRQIGTTRVRLGEAELSRRHRELELEVKTAFCRALAAERFVEVAGELVRVAEASTLTARRRVAAGAATDQELLRAEIPLEQARAALAGFQRDRETARLALAGWLGLPNWENLQMAGRLAETANPGLLNADPTAWLADHPNLKAAQTRWEQAELEGRRARLDVYPDVKVSLGGGRLGDTGHSIVQLGFSVPLPVFDRARGRQREARAQAEVADAETEAEERQLRQSWNTASQRYRAAVEQAASYRDRILPKTSEALRLVQTGFEHGKFGFIDLLDTQRTAAEAQLAYHHKLLELNLAQVQLETLLTRNPGAAQRQEVSQPKTRE
jgi:cobalt-zinc-cadmium efflux system outer membrane protein